jgi:hypothetical protein
MKKAKKATSHMKTHGNNPYEHRILSAHSDTEWDAFVEKTVGGEVFHTRAWLKLCEHYQGTHLVRLGFFENKTLVAVFPLFLRRYVILKVACSPFLLGPPMGSAISPGLDCRGFGTHSTLTSPGLTSTSPACCFRQVMTPLPSREGAMSA